MATIFAEQHKCQPLLPTHEGRVQAERPTRTRPQGQGHGPEGERSMNSIARLVRAVGVLVDALSKWIG